MVQTDLIQDVASNLPRIDYTGGVGSWKFEPQRTNLIPYSQDIITGWSTIRVTVQNNQTISPDGVLNAALSTVTSDSGSHASFETLNGVVTAGNNYYISCFVKKSTTRYIRLNEGYVNDVVTFDLDTQTFVITQGSPTDVIFEDYGNGWYRIGYKFVAHSSGNTQFVLYINDNNNNISYAGNGEAIYLWGVQIEAGSYPTSYIRSNSGSATTRLADAANNAGSSDLINSTEGVLYAEISALADDSTNRQMTLSDGTNTNRLVLKYDNQSNIIQSFNRVGGVESAFLSATILDITLFSKCLVKYKENDYQLWINGYKLDTDTNSTVWPSSTLNDFKINEGGGADFFGNVKSLAVFKEALTDLELECLVSWMSFSDLGINFGYTVE